MNMHKSSAAQPPVPKAARAKLIREVTANIGQLCVAAAQAVAAAETRPHVVTKDPNARARKVGALAN